MAEVVVGVAGGMGFAFFGFIVFSAFTFWFMMRRLAQSQASHGSSTGPQLRYVTASKAESDISATMTHREEDVEQSGFERSWTAWDMEEAHAALTGTTVMQPRMCEALLGGTPVHYEGGTAVRMFDWHFSRKVGKCVYVTLSQTGAVVNSVAADLPAMTLRPRDARGLNRFLDSYLEEVSGAVLFNYQAEFESKSSGEQFFCMPYVMEELIPFVRDRNWSVEWTGDTLLVYQLEQLVPPHELQAFADDVMFLVEMLHEAAGKYSYHRNQQVAAFFDV